MKKNSGIIVALVVAIITAIGYMFIVGNYPYGVSDRSESYYNTLLLIKTILLGVNLLVDAGIMCLYIRQRGNK